MNKTTPKRKRFYIEIMPTVGTLLFYEVVCKFIFVEFALVQPSSLTITFTPSHDKILKCISYDSLLRDGKICKINGVHIHVSFS